MSGAFSEIKSVGKPLLYATAGVLLLSMARTFQVQHAESGDVVEACCLSLGLPAFAAIIASIFSIVPRFRSPKAKIKVVFATAALLFLAPPYKQAPSADWKLRAIANRINKMSPCMTEDSTRLEGATVGPGALLTLKYTFVAQRKADLDRDGTTAKIAPDLRSRVFQKDSFNAIFDAGGTLIFQFRDKDGDLILEVPVKPEERPNQVPTPVSVTTGADAPVAPTAAAAHL